MFPIKSAKAYIAKYLFKSDSCFTIKNISPTLASLTAIFLNTVFLKSSIPWKNQLISNAAAINSKNSIL